MTKTTLRKVMTIALLAIAGITGVALFLAWLWSDTSVFTSISEDALCWAKNPFVSGTTCFTIPVLFGSGDFLFIKPMYWITHMNLLGFATYGVYLTSLFTGFGIIMTTKGSELK